jgi:hypothetical protein
MYIAYLANVTVFTTMKEDSNLRQRAKNNMSAKKKLFYY